MRLRIILGGGLSFGVMLFAAPERFVYDYRAGYSAIGAAKQIERITQLVRAQLKLAVYVAERTDFFNDNDFFALNWADESCCNMKCRNKRFLCSHERARAVRGIASGSALATLYERCFSDALTAPSRESLYSDSQLLRWAYEKSGAPAGPLECTKSRCKRERECCHVRGFERSVADAWDEKGIPLFIASLVRLSQANVCEVVAALERVHDFLSGFAPLGSLDNAVFISDDWRIAYSKRLLAYNWHAFHSLFSVNWLTGKERRAAIGDARLCVSRERYYPYRQPLRADQARKSNRIVQQALVTLRAASSSCTELEGGDGHAARAYLGLIDRVVVADDRSG